MGPVSASMRFRVDVRKNLDQQKPRNEIVNNTLSLSGGVGATKTGAGAIKPTPIALNDHQVVPHPAPALGFGE